MGTLKRIVAVTVMGVLTLGLGGCMFSGPSDDRLKTAVEAVDGVVEARLHVNRPGAPWNTEIDGVIVADVSEDQVATVMAQSLLAIADAGGAQVVRLSFYRGTELQVPVTEMPSLFDDSDVAALSLGDSVSSSQLGVDSSTGYVSFHGGTLNEWAADYRERTGG